jgi:predicted patatin/cPLA2 family phospholipase
MAVSPRRQEGRVSGSVSMKMVLLASRRLFLGLLALAALSLAACSTLERKNAVPPGLRRSTSVLGIPNARFFRDQPAQMIAEQKQQLIREAKTLGVTRGGEMPTAYLLSLSGGGDDGAFGAGLLTGWTAHGDRPKFKMVTGVSTGALISPFAFLGPDYDAALTDVFTNINQSDIFTKRFPTAALTDDAMADTAPLFGTISKYVDAHMMARIAEEYEKGRVLMIQTTDLDAGYPVIWNIGAIAEVGTPEALHMIRRIMLASASIPAAFPPVMFDVDAGGGRYQEMHVDGGASSQAFLIPTSVDPRIARAEAGFHRNTAVYIIRNSRLTTEWTDTERKTLSVAGKGVTTMINYSGISDFYRMYLETLRINADFNLAYIDEDFHAPHKEDFDQTYMRALYRYAHDKAAKGYPWLEAPPGFRPGEN